MTVNAITDTKKGRTGIAPTYLHTTQEMIISEYNVSNSNNTVYVSKTR